jgi:lipid-A-disaccharide synthase
MPRSQMKKLFILAGEISGDTHGAGLMRALLERDGSIEFLGYGGPQMRQAGGEKVIDWVEQAAVLGLWEVLKHYGFFKKKMAESVARVAAENPQAVVLIDYPGFNLRLAKALREAGYAGQILYYISPQVWAWKKGRVKIMAKLLDLMICIFPFEKELYERSGLRTVFAGHPMVDRVHTLRRNWPRERGLVGFLPGSRANEVRKLFPVMMETAKLLRQQQPGARFAVSAANPRLAQLMMEIINASDMPEARQWVETGSVYDLMQRAEVGVVASGTATLEAACFGLPYLLVYKVNPVTYTVGKAVVRIKHLGIVNILAGETVVKEMIQGDFQAGRLADELCRLLGDPSAREALTARLGEVVATLGEGGAYGRAAEAVLQQLHAAKAADANP